MRKIDTGWLARNHGTKVSCFAIGQEFLERVLPHDAVAFHGPKHASKSSSKNGSSDPPPPPPPPPSSPGGGAGGAGGTGAGEATGTTHE
jgi:hypothetical protein